MKKILCKKDYNKQYNDGDIIHHLTEGKWYLHFDSDKKYPLLSNYYEVIANDTYILIVSKEYFYTEKELRKNKLLKLNNI
jgi:hypothetical protein